MSRTIIKSAEKTPDEKILTTLCVTHRCNNNCLSCIRGEKFRKLDDFTLDEIRGVVEKIYGRVKTIFITGGEPTIRNDLKDIVLFIQEKLPETEIGLLSNCRMFYYRDFARDFFSGMSKNKIYVAAALYSGSPDVHEKITRVKDSFKQTSAGLKNLSDLGIKTEIRIVVNALNYKSLPRTAEFITEKFKPFKVTFVGLHILPFGNVYANINEVGVRLTDTVPFVQKAFDMLKKSGISARFYHYPLCVLDEKYRKEGELIALQKNKVIFLGKCEKCSLKDKCCGLWDFYTSVYGEDEFEPLEERK